MSATATTWAIDPTHSEVQFKVKHLVISTVTGHFRKFSGEAVFEGDTPDQGNIRFSIDPASIDTNQEQRDGHLKSPDFFDTEAFPEIAFVSTALTRVSNGQYKLNGNLNIKGVTKPVTVDVEYGGKAVDAYGNTKMGFEVTGTVNRKEFGLTWSAVTEAGSIVVGDDIKFTANIQLAKQN